MLVIFLQPMSIFRKKIILIYFFRIFQDQLDNYFKI